MYCIINVVFTYISRVSTSNMLIKFSINIDIKNKEKVPIKCWEPKLYFVINRFLSF